ncbi:hypothetical protein WJX84_006695, partial [Apatococcus fuscideae]
MHSALLRLTSYVFQRTTSQTYQGVLVLAQIKSPSHQCEGALQHKAHRPATIKSPVLRAYSSFTEGGRQVNLKTQLRELYKLIHPDLFHAHPPAQKENERSFKLLQEYLDAGKRGGNPAAAALPYNFKFFLRKGDTETRQDSDASSTIEQDDRDALAKATSSTSPGGALVNGSSLAVGDAMAAEAMGLRCVALLLPPPAPSPFDAVTGE